MKKWKSVLFFALLILVSSTMVWLHIFKNNMNNEIKSYLINQKGYSENELSNIYTQIDKAPVVSTTVIFNDDMSSRYFYRKENGQIYQYSAAPVHGVDDGQTKYKHREDQGT